MQGIDAYTIGNSGKTSMCKCNIGAGLIYSLKYYCHHTTLILKYYAYLQLSLDV